MLAKSERAAKRLLETSTKYLEGTLKLQVNQKKSRVVSVFAIRNFKFPGFTLGKNGKGIYVRVHGKSWKKMKSKLKDLSSRRSVQSIRPSLEKIKVYMLSLIHIYSYDSSFTGTMTQIEEEETASLEKRSQIYQRLIEMLSLSETHRRKLMDRGLTSNQIEAFHFRSTPVHGLSLIHILRHQKFEEVSGVLFFC